MQWSCFSSSRRAAGCFAASLALFGPANCFVVGELTCLCFVMIFRGNTIHLLASSQMSGTERVTRGGAGDDGELPGLVGLARVVPGHSLRPRAAPPPKVSACWLILTTFPACRVCSFVFFACGKCLTCAVLVFSWLLTPPAPSPLLPIPTHFPGARRGRGGQRGEQRGEQRRGGGGGG